MSGGDDHRARSREMWREVMQADAPPVSDPCTELTTDHLMGRIWTRPGLARRDRRLVTLTIAAVTGQRGPLRNHLRASLSLAISPSRNSMSGSSTWPTTGGGRRVRRRMPPWVKSLPSRGARFLPVRWQTRSPLTRPASGRGARRACATPDCRAAHGRRSAAFRRIGQTDSDLSVQSVRSLSSRRSGENREEKAMAEFRPKYITFDCYGTLIDFQMSHHDENDVRGSARPGPPASVHDRLQRLSL